VTGVGRPKPDRSDKDGPLVVWGERHAEPDWDRFLAALLALALRRVEEDDGTKETRG
jgi:hypothetical protein